MTVVTRRPYPRSILSLALDGPAKPAKAKPQLKAAPAKKKPAAKKPTGRKK